MKTMVVFDSAYGNTRKVAETIAAALPAAQAYHIDAVKPTELSGLDCLVLGSPTQRINYTEAMAEFLEGIPPRGLQGVKVAAFDTRISIPDIQNKASKMAARVFLHRYAAKPLARILKSKGGQEIVAPEGFYVLDTEGPLLEGELERAREWAAQIAAKIAPGV